ncbi:hypothetical protein LLS47_23825 [Rouxiella badensis]|uniref:hypothetical protein n=1 Tax=Rouxiella badensis TaxID=1646377 RepID=UPI001D14A926|nr:hypothetical protein [Rouxiella badensis]MCC3735931.1 hypothetical protein [Rouxiella badensis]MCC3761337.1 hypothetical protein [Rouxiella badensis]
MTERLITCSHCRSKIPHGANVCSGCRSEIQYGMPPIMLLVALLVPAGLALYLDKLLYNRFGLGNTMLWTVWGVITAVGFFGLTYLFMKACKNRIEFTRQKNK